LLVALPFIFFTNEYHVLPPHTLQSGQPPSTIQITKRFLNAQTEAIKEEFESARCLGAATAEEWLKGLEERGKEKKADGARWERWESTGGVLSMRHSDDGGLANSFNVEASALVKKETVMKAESSASLDGTSPISRYRPANSLPSRNFPPFTASRPSHPTQASLRKFFLFCLVSRLRSQVFGKAWWN
jgi:hypothetical protein